MTGRRDFMLGLAATAAATGTVALRLGALTALTLRTRAGLTALTLRARLALAAAGTTLVAAGTALLELTAGTPTGTPAAARAARAAITLGATAFTHRTTGRRADRSELLAAR